jgi:hypothetical protein
MIADLFLPYENSKKHLKILILISKVKLKYQFNINELRTSWA